MSKIIKFIKEVRQEFDNITWPKKDTLIELSFVVISISIIISLILGGFDYLFTKSFALLTKQKNQPTQTIIPPEATESTDLSDFQISTDSADIQLPDDQN